LPLTFDNFGTGLFLSRTNVSGPTNAVRCLRDAPATSGHPGERSQSIENAGEKVGAKLGIATFLPMGAPLSEQIYKICTLLSTAIVENRRPQRLTDLRKAFAGAGFGGIPGERPAGGR
jgi:hypothetical protein